MSAETLTPTPMAARWRRDVSRYLTKMAAMVADGRELVGIDSMSVETPYGVVLAIIGPDGVVVGSCGVRRRADRQRISRAIQSAFEPRS